MPPPKVAATQFLNFVNESPTPYHAVASASALLKEAGFSMIRERDNWTSTLRPGGKYFLTRNGSSIVALALGAKWKPGSPVAMIGAHTDSPCLRVKPISRKSSVGFMQVGVECYGGGIWHSWFDRDLSLAGRVMVRDGDGTIVPRLIKVDRPILRIPTLAIHLDRSLEFKPNKETELFPIAGLAAVELNRVAPSAHGDYAGGGATGKEDATKTLEEKEKLEGGETPSFQPLGQISERHHPHILEIVAQEAGVPVHNILDFELVLYDTQKACLGGMHDEFIFSPRLDNLNSVFCSISALVESVRAPGSLDGETGARLVACFDHEEIGSTSAQGADSDLLPSVLYRLAVLPAQSHQSTVPTHSDPSNDHVVNADADANLATAYKQTLARSFLISADMAHSVHPNYVAKYESSHQPMMNKGVVIKVNANQRYATNSPGIVLIQEAARLATVPLQLFVVRNDSPCGSTIGPTLSAKLGLRTLDLGNPQLSMHSIRETGGSDDVDHAIKLFTSYLQNFVTLESQIIVD